MNSALYFGRVVHRRRRPVPHAFSYRVFLAYLDLAELPGVFAKRWLWSARRPAVARFRRSDYLGDPAKPLDQAVRELVRKELGREAPGPIRLLTHLRYFGYVQNPVSFYYCFDAADREVPLEHGRRIAAAWPGASLELVEGVGHRRILRDAKVIARVTRHLLAT